MKSETVANIVSTFFIFLIVFLSVKRKNKKSGKRESGPMAGVRPGNSSGFTVREMAREKTDLTGKVHSKSHTHDRLDFDCYVPENQAEHYRKQLDSFLAAGLIERAEYRAILERYRSQGIL